MKRVINPASPIHSEIIVVGFHGMVSALEEGAGTATRAELEEPVGQERSSTQEGENSMSVSSLTNVAYKRRKDVAPTDSMPRSAGEVAAATGDASATQSTFTSALTALMAYIPTEILTAYVAVLAGLQVADQQTQAPPGAWVSFWVFLVLTPTMVWAIYAGKCRVAGKVLPTSPGKWTMWEMSAATVAFVVWAFALPNTGFADLGWYKPGLATAAVLLVTLVLAAVAPIVQQPIEGD